MKTMSVFNNLYLLLSVSLQRFSADDKDITLNSPSFQLVNALEILQIRVPIQQLVI